MWSPKIAGSLIVALVSVVEASKQRSVLSGVVRRKRIVQRGVGDGLRQAKLSKRQKIPSEGMQK
jgi:hypothetical protein